MNRFAAINPQRRARRSVRHESQGRPSRKLVAALAAAAALLCATALGAAEDAAAAGDNLFYQQAAGAGLAEVDFGRLAVSRAADPRVKEFGSMMVADHTKASGELAELAKSKSALLPMELDSDHKDARAKLNALTGAAFDAAYIQMQVADHREVESLLKKEIASGKDAQAKAWASSALPVVQAHLKRAQELATALPRVAADEHAGMSHGRMDAGGHSSHSGASIDSGSAGPSKGVSGVTNSQSTNEAPSERAPAR